MLIPLTGVGKQRERVREIDNGKKKEEEEDNGSASGCWGHRHRLCGSC